MWMTKTFKTKQAFDKWIADRSSRFQWNEIFINNGFGVEYRKLRWIL